MVQGLACGQTRPSLKVHVLSASLWFWVMPGEVVPAWLLRIVEALCDQILPALPGALGSIRPALSRVQTRSGTEGRKNWGQERRLEKMQ